MQAPLPVLFMRAEDVQQVGVVALLGGRHAPGEALKGSFGRSRSPVLQVLSENGGLATTKSKVLSRSPSLKCGAGQGVALPDVGRRAVVQDHVHAGQARGGAVHLLPVERDVLARLRRAP